MKVKYKPFAKNVIEKLSPRSIILYGSMATGNFGAGSDMI